MRVAVVGGTRFLGPVAVRLLLQAGHEVTVVHSGAHEHPAADAAEHLHGSREDLLRAGGLVERWRPEVIVDTFAGGATAKKADMTRDCAARAGGAASSP